MDHNSMIEAQIALNAHFLLLRAVLALYAAGCVYVGYRLGVALVRGRS